MDKKNNSRLIGRDKELAFLEEIAKKEESSIIIVHGRRRVGKTTLIEHVFKKRNLIKIEGLESGGQDKQLKQIISQLIPQLKDYPVANWNPKNFTDLFRLLEPIFKKGAWTFFLEEYQWLSSYNASLTSELKIAWDNWFRKNQKFKLILCGSSPSFMVNKVLMSKALYNRSQYELMLQPFTFLEAQELLPKIKDAFSVYLLLGGIPEYLKRINKSWLISFYQQAFAPTGFFVDEFKRIIVSSLSSNPHYEKVLKFLAKKKFVDRPTLAKHLNIPLGGSLTDLLTDLEQSGFICSYVPIDKKPNSILKRYKISDFFLKTYFKFIEPNYHEIKKNNFQPPTLDQIKSHLGYAFEEFCSQNHAVIGKILGFSGIKYKFGSYFFRKEENFQIDLIFIRADGIHTICEIKYADKIQTKNFLNYEKAVSIYKNNFNVEVQRVLISNSIIKNSEMAFDRVIYLDEILANL